MRDTFVQLGRLAAALGFMHMLRAHIHTHTHHDSLHLLEHCLATRCAHKFMCTHAHFLPARQPALTLPVMQEYEEEEDEEEEEEVYDGGEEEGGEGGATGAGGDDDDDDVRLSSTSTAHLFHSIA